MKRLDRDLDKKEKDEIEVDFMDYVIENHINISNFIVTKLSMKKFVDFLGDRWDDWYGIPNFNAVFGSNCIRSMTQKVRNIVRDGAH